MKMAADRAWLKSVYRKMRRAVDWTMKARRVAPADSAFDACCPTPFRAIKPTQRADVLSHHFVSSVDVTECGWSAGTSQAVEGFDSGDGDLEE